MHNSSYTNKLWNEYSHPHLSVMTSMQMSLFTDAISYLQGDVIDCGCGTARLAPLLADQDSVHSYTGVDYSSEMVNMAVWLVTHYSTKSFNIINDKIENLTGKIFNSAVSIHSYYTWPDTEKVLTNIYNLLAPEGKFILVTPNPSMDMRQLLKESEKELIGHPDFAEFKKLNMLLANNLNAKFISMDNLVEETRRCRFQILECHQKHYLGGVNFLVLKK